MEDTEAGDGSDGHVLQQPKFVGVGSGDSIVAQRITLITPKQRCVCREQLGAVILVGIADTAPGAADIDRLRCVAQDTVQPLIIQAAYQPFKGDTDLDDYDYGMDEDDEDYTEEVEAESISYAVCQYFGIETADNSFGYIASWSQGKELKELRASLETINKTSSELISGIEQHYREICKEQGIDLAADAPAQEQPRVPDNAATVQTVEANVPPEAPSPDTPEQVLDEYPMPDESLKAADLEACGYLDGDMLPLSREWAAELYDQDLSVYAIVDGGNAEMLFDREELDTQASGTMFAVSREEWEQSPMFHKKILERQQHQEEREKAFLAHGGDCFAIYQVKRDDPGNVRFMNMDWMQSHGKAIARGSYDLIYTAPLTATGSIDAKLEAIFEQFNLHRPADYHSPSLSVSDIVAIKQDGVVSYHYCDSVGFKELPDFRQENYLKAAEMSMEDDYGMIDGIINNGKQPTVADLEQQR